MPPGRENELLNLSSRVASAFRRAACRWPPLFLPGVLSVLVLSGCGPSFLQSPAAPPTHTYLLEWQGTAGKKGAANAPNLLVSPVLAAPGFDGSDMAYMRTPHEIEYFARHRWVDSPARMLEPLLVRAAAQSGLFSSVIEAGTGTRADLRLDSRLLHLQQVCRLNPSELQLALRVSLVEVASARLIASRVLSVSEPIAERSPYAGVEAANRAVDRLLKELQQFLATQLGEAGH